MDKAQENNWVYDTVAEKGPRERSIGQSGRVTGQGQEQAGQRV